MRAGHHDVREASPRIEEAFDGSGEVHDDRPSRCHRLREQSSWSGKGMEVPGEGRDHGVPQQRLRVRCASLCSFITT